MPRKTLGALDDAMKNLAPGARSGRTRQPRRRGSLPFTEDLTYGFIRAEARQVAKDPKSPPIVARAANPFSQLARLERVMRDGIQRFNSVLSDDIPRRAAWYRVAQKHRKLTNAIEGTNVTLSEFLEDLRVAAHTPAPLRTARMEKAKKTHDELVQRVLDMLIDFDDLSSFERRVMRRAIPFFSWLKGMTLATGRLGIHHPEQVVILSMLAQHEQGQKTIEHGSEFGAELFESFAQLGQDGDNVFGLGTAGLNPFHTVGDVVGIARSIFSESERPTENLALQGNPLLQSAIEAFSGKELFGGRKIPGGLAERFARQFGTSFPQVSTPLRIGEPKTTKSGEPRFTQPGVKFEVPGISQLSQALGGPQIRTPQEAFRYAGVPLTTKSLTARDRIVKRHESEKRTPEEGYDFELTQERDASRGKHERTTGEKELPREMVELMDTRDDYRRRREDLKRAEFHGRALAAQP